MRRKASHRARSTKQNKLNAIFFHWFACCSEYVRVITTTVCCWATGHRSSSLPFRRGELGELVADEICPDVTLEGPSYSPAHIITQ